MSVQTTYNYNCPAGSPGGIVDLAPHTIDSFINGETTGKMKFGVGVVQGDNPGTDVKFPTAATTAAKFEGVTVNNRTTEYDMEGNLHIRHGKTLGVMRTGRIYARVASGAAVKYGDVAYLVKEGANAGLFTNTASSTEGSSTVAIKGRFLSGVDSTTQTAVLELFNQAQA